MDEARRKEALAEIERMVRRIVKGFNPQKIILFGPYARGTFGIDSDVDLLIVMNLPKPKKEVTTEIDRTLIDRRLPLDIIVVSPEEAELYRGLAENVIRPALEEGRVLFARAA